MREGKIYLYPAAVLLALAVQLCSYRMPPRKARKRIFRGTFVRERGEEKSDKFLKTLRDDQGILIDRFCAEYDLTRVRALREDAREAAPASDRKQKRQAPAPKRAHGGSFRIVNRALQAVFFKIFVAKFRLVRARRCIIPGEYELNGVRSVAQNFKKANEAVKIFA